MGRSVSAGSAYVSLYLRTQLFDRQVAQAPISFQNAMANMASNVDMPDFTEQLRLGMEDMGDVAYDVLSLMYDDTMDLAEATEDLNDILERVMETYEGLSDMQSQGITLNAGGGGQGIGGPQQYDRNIGFDEEQFMPEVGEGFEELGGSAVKGTGIAVGSMAMTKAMSMVAPNFAMPMVPELLKKIGVGGGAAAGGAGTAAAVGGLGASATAATPAMTGLTVGTQAATVAMTELAAAVTSASVAINGLLGTTAAEAPVMATLATATTATAPAMAATAASTAAVAPAMAATTAASATTATAFTTVAGTSNVVSRSFDIMRFKMISLSTGFGRILQAVIQFGDALIGLPAQTFAHLAKQMAGGSGRIWAALKRATLAMYGFAKSMLSTVAAPFITMGNAIASVAVKVWTHLAVATKSMLLFGDAMISSVARPVIMAMQAMWAAVAPAAAQLGTLALAFIPVQTMSWLGSLALNAFGTAATWASGAVKGLIATLSAVNPLVWALAAALAVATPLLALIDEKAGGKLSSSGMYPKFLKNIGDAILGWGPNRMILNMLIDGFNMTMNTIKLLWAIASPILEALGVVLKAVLFPIAVQLKVINAVLRVAIAIWKALMAPINAILHPIKTMKNLFGMIIGPLKKVGEYLKPLGDGLMRVGKVVGSYLLAGLKKIPGLAMSAVKGLMRLASAGISAAKSIASGAWNAALGTLRSVNASINSIGSSMQTIGKRVAMAGGGMVALGAAITVPLTKAAQQFKAFGNRIDGLTEKYRHFGVTAETMSVYAYAASQATGRLGQMGEEERINNLMQSMKTGSAEFAQWTKQAGAAGAIMGGDGVKSALSLTVAYNRLQGALSGLWMQLGSAVAPAIENSTEIMVGAIRGVTNWVMQNKQLIATVFKVAAAVGAAGTAIAAAGGALAGLGTILTPVTAALAVVAGGMAVVEYRTKVGATLWGSYKNSMMGMYKTFMENIKPIVEEAQKVIGGVISAIKGGDLALAAKIAWGGLKLAWMEGLLWLSDRTSGAFSGILANLAAGNWKKASDGAMGAVMAAFLKLQDVADRVWLNILNYADGLWTGLQNGFATAFGGIEKLWMNTMEKFKRFGYDAFYWIVTNAIRPALAAMVKMDPTGMMKGKAESIMLDLELIRVKAHRGLKDKEELASAGEVIDAKTVAKQDANDAALADRRLDRASEYFDRYADRADAIADAEARGVGEQGPKDQEIARLREELATLQATARAKEEDAKKQPDNMKFGKLEGSVTTSAFAFGQFASAPKDDMKTVAAEATRTRMAQEREEKRKDIRDKEFDRRWKELTTMLKNFGLFT